MSVACKFCNRPISWVRTAAGAYMPIDSKAAMRWVELRPGMWQRVFTYSSHLDTCPNRKKEPERKDNPNE